MIGIGIIVGYLLYKVISKKEKINIYSDILINKEYRVKGQWDKE